MSNDPFKLGKAKGIRSTAKALLVEIEDDPEEKPERWIPLSVIHDDSECYEDGTEGELVVHLWWAEKNGLT